MEKKVSKELQEKSLIALFDAIEIGNEVLVGQLEKAFIKNNCWQMNSSLEPVLRRLIARASCEKEHFDLVEKKLIEYLMLERAPYSLAFDFVFNTVVSAGCSESLKVEFNLSNLIRIRDAAQSKELDILVEQAVKGFEKKGNKKAIKLNGLNLDTVSLKESGKQILEPCVRSWCFVGTEDKLEKKLIKVKSKKFEALKFTLKSKMQQPEKFYFDMVDFLEKRATNADEENDGFAVKDSANLVGPSVIENPARAGVGGVGAQIVEAKNKGSNKKLIYWQEYLSYIQGLYMSTVMAYTQRVSRSDLRRVGVPSLGLIGAHVEESGEIKGAIRVDSLNSKEQAILNLCLASYENFLEKIKTLNEKEQFKLKKFYDLNLQEGLFYSVSEVCLPMHFKKFLDLGASYKLFWHTSGLNTGVGWSSRGKKFDKPIFGIKSALSELSYFSAKTVLNILDKKVLSQRAVGDVFEKKEELRKNLDYVLFGLKNSSMSDADGASALSEILCIKTASGQQNVEMKHSVSIMKRTLLELEDFIGTRELSRGQVQSLLNACTSWAIGFAEKRLMLDKKAYQERTGSKVEYVFLKQPPASCLEFDAQKWLKDVTKFLIERCSDELSLNDLLISRLDLIEGNSSYYAMEQRVEHLKSDFADEMFEKLWIEGDEVVDTSYKTSAQTSSLQKAHTSNSGLEKQEGVSKKELLMDKFCELNFGYKDWMESKVGVKTKKERLEDSLRMGSRYNMVSAGAEDGPSAVDFEKQKPAIRAQMLKEIEKTKSNLMDSSKHWFWRYGNPGVLSYYNLLNALIEAGIKSGLSLTYKKSSNKESLAQNKSSNDEKAVFGGDVLSDKEEEIKVSVGKMLSPGRLVLGRLNDLTSQMVDQNALNISLLETLVFKEELCEVKPGALINNSKRIDVASNEKEKDLISKNVEENPTMKKIKML